MQNLKFKGRSHLTGSSTDLSGRYLGNPRCACSPRVMLAQHQDEASVHNLQPAHDTCLHLRRSVVRIIGIYTLLGIPTAICGGVEPSDRLKKGVSSQPESEPKW